MDLDASLPESAPRHRSWAAIGGIVLMACSLGLFAWWWGRFGRAPVLRSPESVGPLYSFLAFWTRAFLLSAAAGCALGLLGLKRDRKLALGALFGNAAWLVFLLVLRQTS